MSGREPMATSAPAIVSFDDVTCRYGEVLAVDRVSLQLPPGAIVGLVGPSGSGKTTIVRTMRGAVTPEHGSVRVFGHDPRRMPQRDRRRLGYMPQHFSLYPDLSAEENVDFVASLFGLLFPRRRRRTKEVLRTVDLWDARHRRAEHLSGGMKRRLQLAATLVHEPVLLLLDEPTAGLDPLLRARVWEEIRKQRDAGHTMLVTTQYVGEAEECDFVALIVEGRLAALGTPSELRSKAVGGEVLAVETSRRLTDDELRDMPEVREARRTGGQRVRLVVESAPRALPLIVEWLSGRGIEVAQANEERPTFDDVFTALVHRAHGDEDSADGVEAVVDSQGAARVIPEPPGDGSPDAASPGTGEAASPADEPARPVGEVRETADGEIGPTGELAPTGELGPTRPVAPASAAGTNPPPANGANPPAAPANGTGRSAPPSVGTNPPPPPDAADPSAMPPDGITPTGRRRTP